MSVNWAPSKLSYHRDTAFAETLAKIGGTLIISSSKNNKLIFISSYAKDRIGMLSKDFEQPSGIAINGDRLALATKHQVTEYQNVPALAKAMPKRHSKLDHCFVPRVNYFTGDSDIHDLHYGQEGLLAVNTAYSCLVKITADYSFQPIWKPYFIDKLEYSDRCHLNGLALSEGQPLYISALGYGNQAASWKETLPNGGILMHIPSNSIILNNLPVPHTPRLYEGKLFALLSAKGTLICIDPERSSYDVVCKIQGFVRGMYLHQGYAIIATSQIRKKSSSFGKIPFHNTKAGLTIVQLDSGQIVGRLDFEGVEEIYDVQHLTGINNLQFLTTETDGLFLPVHLPENSHWISPLTRRSYEGSEDES